MGCTRQHQYARGTWTETVGPWAAFIRARAVCPDGKLRVVKLSICADTFYTVPARVSWRGLTVCGFITFRSADGLSTNPKQWVEFCPTGRHSSAFTGPYAPPRDTFEINPTGDPSDRTGWNVSQSDGAAT